MSKIREIWETRRRSNINIPNPAIPQPNIPENGKKRLNLFTKPAKNNPLEMIEPKDGVEKTTKRGKKKTPKNSGGKKDNEGLPKAKRKRRIPAKFIDGFDFSDEKGEASSVSLITNMHRQTRSKTVSFDLDSI